ncbi:cobalamin B12-binding domain-containing protein [Saliterribacillus persicus]|uniref:Methanogenic corrinoid protein MtbC1 n=1 Tax=Saliterribacillus persicus TaxID=930114 RepID=A0A368XP71_9BACI|nr:cobalamin-dependent protein [Saliterribacillus persicus]RCW69800.1 methanogenic corrinoid protein MtbC1 [Saliterribacillus persicus]
MQQTYEKFAAFLLEGNHKEAYELLQNEKEDSLTIYMEIVTKAMQHIGELWQTNQITVADEHLATSVCDYVLSHYTFKHMSKEEETAKHKIMFLCLEEEQHTIGTKMAAALCQEKNWKVKLLGANLPLEYVISSANKWKPDVIGLSAAIAYRLPVLKQYIETLEELEGKPKVIISGRLASTFDLSNYQSDQTFVLKDLRSFNSWLENYQKGVSVNGAS